MKHEVEKIVKGCRLSSGPKISSLHRKPETKLILHLYRRSARLTFVASGYQHGGSSHIFFPKFHLLVNWQLVICVYIPRFSFLPTSNISSSFGNTKYTLLLHR